MATIEPIEIPVRLSGIAALKNDFKNIRNDIASNLSVLDELTEKSKKYMDAIAKGGSAAEMDRLNKALKINEQRIAQATERNAALSASAGQVRDRMIQVNEQVSVFATGSDFEAASNSLGLIGSQLGSLDFEGAGESALILQNQIQNISAESIQRQVQGLQQTFTVLGRVAGQSLLGLIKNIGGIAKAFMAFGAQLLMNPIFLIVGAFIAIATVIGLLLNKLGFLQPILDGIGYVFGLIGDAIDEVVQNIKDFLDLIGLTDFAAEDSARRQTEAAEKKADAYEKSSKRVQFYLDEEIKLAGIAGKDTTALEIKKQVSIRETAKVRLEALRAKIAENKLTNELDAEEIKALHEKITAQKELVRSSTSEIKIIKAQEVADEKKSAEDAAKESKANAKEAAAKRKQYAENRIQAERQVKDIELASLKEGNEKEVALINEKYKRILEDLKKNESLTAEEKKKLVDVNLIQKKKELDTLAEVALDAEIAAVDERIAAFDVLRLEEIEKLRKEGVSKNDLRILLLKDGLEKELEYLENEKAKELANVELNESDKAIIEERYRLQKEEKEKEYRDRKLEQEKAAQQSVYETTEKGLTSLSNLNDLVFEIKKKKLADGSAAEEAAAKENFERNKKIQISVAIISGIQGTINALTANSVIPEPFGMAAKIANALVVASSTAASIAKIKGTSYGGGGGGTGSSVSTPNSTGGAKPATNLFGNPNDLNNLSGTKSMESKPTQKIVVKAYVSQDEMTIQQKVSNSILDNASM